MTNAIQSEYLRELVYQAREGAPRVEELIMPSGIFVNLIESNHKRAKIIEGDQNVVQG